MVEWDRDFYAAQAEEGPEEAHVRQNQIQQTRLDVACVYHLGVCIAIIAQQLCHNEKQLSTSPVA